MGDGRKLGNPEEIQTDTGRVAGLSTDRGRRNNGKVRQVARGEVQGLMKVKIYTSENLYWVKMSFSYNTSFYG